LSPDMAGHRPRIITALNREIRRHLVTLNYG
jgi:hypothetical protein